MALIAPVVAARASGVDALSLSLDRTVLVSGTTQVIKATVKATTAGIPQAGINVPFSTSGDAVLSSPTCKTSSAGSCFIYVTPGVAYGQQLLSATVVNSTWSGSASAAFFQYDAPTSISLGLSRASLTADGASMSELTATVTDAAGRGIPDEPLGLSLSEPSVPAASFTDAGNGTYTAAVEPPPDPSHGSSPYSDVVTVTVPSPSLSAGTTIALTNPTPRLTGPLSTATSGGQAVLEEASGQAVTLHGIDVPDIQYPYYAPYTNPDYPPPSNPAAEVPPVTAQEIGTAYEWGANYVRLMISSDLWLNSNRTGPCQSHPSGGSGYDPAYQQLVKDVVSLITSYGMLAVVDLHVTDPNCSASNPLFGWAPSGGLSSSTYPLPSSADATAFWSQVASDFGSNPLAAFELYNEPQVCSLGPTTATIVSEFTEPYHHCAPMGGYSSDQAAAAAWVRGGTLTTGVSSGNAKDHIEGNKSTTYGAAGMASMYEAVRQNGAPGNLVFLDANNFAWDRTTFDQMTKLGMPQVTNGVYVFHYYDCQGSGNPASCQSAVPESCSYIESVLAGSGQDPLTGQAWPAPVVYDEIGWPETATQGKAGSSTFSLYQRGLFMSDTIATLQSLGEGWSIFAYEPTFLPGTAYSVVFSTPVGPWQASPDGAPAEAAMSGTIPTCTEPPLGYG